MAMNEVIAFFIAAFASLLTIVNPFSTASIFLTITRGDSKEKKKLMVKKACWTAFFVLIVFSLIGGFILNFFSITLDAFKIAGGILITGVGLKMITAKREHLSSDEEKKEATIKDDVSIVPLAIPMLSGPGAITTSLVLMGEAGGVSGKGVVLLAIFAVIVISYFTLLNASVVDKYLGETGKRVVDRIMGLIVLVVGVQFFINGIEGILQGWGMIGIF